jgi:hypothetical protein
VTFDQVGSALDKAGERTRTVAVVGNKQILRVKRRQSRSEPFLGVTCGQWRRRGEYTMKPSNFTIHLQTVGGKDVIESFLKMRGKKNEDTK